VLTPSRLGCLVQHAGAMDSSPAKQLTEALYRPGPQFTTAELQILVQDSAIRPVIGDVYAPARLPDSPGLRARCCRELLSSALRQDAVICGETAAWIHLGGPFTPTRIAVITQGVFRRRTSAKISWQVHQLPLDSQDILRLHEVSVTSPRRTAADVFLGIGVAGSRRPLDLPPVQSSAAVHSAAPQIHEEITAYRWGLIARLSSAHPEALQAETLTAQILSQLRESSGAQARSARISALLQARVFARGS